MNKITEKVHKEVVDKMKPFIQQMIDAGISKDRIINIINDHTKRKLKEYYKEDNPFELAINELKRLSRDSKAEVIFYDLLTEKKIRFKFQYNIGPYRVDFLIEDKLVFELDGPRHFTEKQKEHDRQKDKYLERMGYQVLRLPIYIVSLDREAVLEGIKEVVNG